MNRRASLRLISVVLMVTLIAVGASAQDYVPSPGVLSPDEVDFGGATVTIIGYVKPEDFGPGTPQEGRLEEAMELFNIGKFELIYRPGAEFIMTRIMTGEATHDILHDDWRERFFTMASNGMLWSMDELLPQEYYDNLGRIDKIVQNETLPVGGQRYTFGHVYGEYIRPTGMAYNQSMLERLGLPDIYDLWKSGNWTWEQAEKYAIAATKDTDGDGNIDQWGITYRRADYGIYINNAQAIKKGADGKYRYGLADEESIWILEKLAEMYAAGYIVPKALDAKNRIEQGTVLMQFGYDSVAPYAQNGDKLVYAPHPIGPHTDRHIWPAWCIMFAAIPITAENPKGLIAVHDFLFRPEDRSLDTMLETEITQLYPHRESAEAVMFALETWNGEVEWINGLKNTPEVEIDQASHIWPLIRGEKSPRSFLESCAPVVQSLLTCCSTNKLD